MKRAPLTQTALDAIIKEAAKARLTLNDAIKACVENSWQGFKSDWYLNVNKQANGQRKMPKADDFANKDYSKGMNEDGSF